MDTTIIVLQAFAGVFFAIVAVAASIIVAVFVVMEVRIGVFYVRRWWMRRSIRAVDKWLGRSGV